MSSMQLEIGLQSPSKTFEGFAMSLFRSALLCSSDGRLKSVTWLTQTCGQLAGIMPSFCCVDFERTGYLIFSST